MDPLPLLTVNGIERDLSLEYIETKIAGKKGTHHPISL